MAIIHLGTKIEVHLARLDAEGNASALPPAILWLGKLSREEFEAAADQVALLLAEARAREEIEGLDLRALNEAGG